MLDDSNKDDESGCKGIISELKIGIPDPAGSTDESTPNIGKRSMDGSRSLDSGGRLMDTVDVEPVDGSDILRTRCRRSWAVGRWEVRGGRTAAGRSEAVKNKPS